MELRGCNTHFIQAVKYGLVIKVRNRDSNGKPAFASKTLKDIYDAEDAMRLGRPSPTDYGRRAGLVLNSDGMKRGNPCLPVVDRNLLDTDECFPDANDGIESDLDDETTLTQVRKRCLIRKRKFSCTASDENTSRACANEKGVEDESDLNEPLINWKSKNLKGSKSKRKRTSGGAASSSTNSNSVKSEENHLSESYLQGRCELAPVHHVKVEIQDADDLENQSRTFPADHSSGACNEAPSPVAEASNEFQKMANHECQEPVLPAKGQNYITNEISYEHLEEVEPLYMLVPWDACNESCNPVGEASNKIQKMADRECLGLVFPAKERQICVANEISYEHLEDDEPLYMIVPWEGNSVKLENPDFSCQEFPDSSALAIEMRSEIEEACSSRTLPAFGNYSEVYDNFGDSSRTEEISEQSSNSGFQFLNMSINGVQIENKCSTDLPQGHDDFLSSPSNKYDSLQDSVISLKTGYNLNSAESTILKAEPPSTCILDTTKDGLNHAGHLEDELSKADGKQTSAPITDIERQSCMENQTFDSADTDSQLTQESHEPPERLLSTRKAISPSSQEQLRQAMSSIELGNDVNQCKPAGKLFEKQTGKRASSLRSDVQHARVAANGGPWRVSQRKVVISPSHIMNKSQNANANLEAPRFSRTLRNLSTGCTSIEGCSESAIAFSQRQLHDMETLAEKLMNELKSMKDIVEQKLLFEAYRNVSLRNDADEVKSAINNATKIEEAAQKWLSMMARDCHRFCKIMKLTPGSASASEGPGPRQKRKIMFADEVGRKLCHVKVFEVRMTDNIKQEDQSVILE